MDNRVRCGFIFIGLFCLLIIGSPAGFVNSRPCCPDDPEVSYLLHPKSRQKFQYRVQYETFFSLMLGKEKGFFIIYPEGFDQEAKGGYPVLFLLHGYNFHRNGVLWKVTSPENANKVLCEVKGAIRFPFNPLMGRPAIITSSGEAALELFLNTTPINSNRV